MKAPKFNFIPERQLKETKVEPMFHCSIYSNGQITFGTEYANIYELDGKNVRFYADPQKKTIGWKIIEGKTSLGELDDSRLVKKDNSHNIIKVSITTLLAAVGVEKGDKYSRLPVHIYKSPSIEGEIHYMQIPEKVVEFVSEKNSLKEKK